MSEQKENRFAQSMEDHSMEGVEVLQDTSSLVAHALIYIILALICIALCWGILTKADVVVKAKGVLGERDEAMKIYSPVDGELVEVFVGEGVPVAKGDMLARIKSAQAIKIASAANQAKISLENASRAREDFPRKKKLLARELESIERQVDFLTKEYDREKEEGMRKMSEGQKRQLETLHLQSAEKKNSRDQAQVLYQKHKRLHAGAGGGGISESQLMAKENELKKAEVEYAKIEASIENMEFEFSRQYLGNKQKIEQLYVKIINNRLQYDQKKAAMDNAEQELDMKHKGALEEWQAASRVNFSDLDENNFLVIRAPIAGEVTRVMYRQVGEKVSSSREIVAISKEHAGKTVFLSIQDKDRGLLKIGQQVKLKFHAFPYRRFGYLTGKLHYISHDAQVTKDKGSLYKGKVSLDQEVYHIDGKQLPVRFGMNTDAEIVVQQRRLIDFAMDPFRKLVK